MQLLACHGLECHREVEGRYGDLRHLLERHDEAFLRDSDIVDPYTREGEVRVGFGHVIPHCVLGLINMSGCIPQEIGEELLMNLCDTKDVIRRRR